MPLVSPLVFGSLVEVEERAIAIEARGFTSPHKKTSLREIQDSGFDRILRSVLVLIVLVVFVLKCGSLNNLSGVSFRAGSFITLWLS